MMSEDKISTGKMFVSAQDSEALAELDKLFSAFFDATNVGLCILDSDLHYIAVNKARAEMNGMPAEAHLGRSVREILGELAAPVEKNISAVLETQQPLRSELSGKLPSRKEASHWIAHYLPIVDAEGLVSRVGAVVLEVTTPNVLEKSLQKLDSQLRQEMRRLQMFD